MFRVNVWLAEGPVPLDAVMVKLVVPAGAPGAAVSVPVPSPLSTKVTPAGSVPVSDSAGAGLPVVMTVKVPPVPAVKLADGGEVIAGAGEAGLMVR